MNDMPMLSDDGLTILLFHGVIDHQVHRVRNYIGKHLEISQFVALLRWLRANGTALSMDDVVGLHQAGEGYPARSFALSFDDGFENNHRLAAPILADHGLPGIFYITTSFIDSNAMSSIDQIEHAIERTQTAMLNVPWSPQALGLATTAEKIATLEAIRSRIKTDAAVNVDLLVASVFEQCNVPAVTSNEDPIDRKMNWAQVREIAAHPLFQIGAHGHRHRILSFLEEQELSAELDASVTLCRNAAGINVTHYAYPEGMSHCYSPRVIEALKSRGVVCCPTAIEGVNVVDTNLFELRRIMPTPRRLAWLGQEAVACAE